MPHRAINHSNPGSRKNNTDFYKIPNNFTYNRILEWFDWKGC